MFELNDLIIAEVEFRQYSVDFLLRELTRAFGEQLKVKLIIDAISFLGDDLMQDPLVQLRPLLDRMAFLYLKEKEIADLCLFVEMYHRSYEVEVISFS